MINIQIFLLSGLILLSPMAIAHAQTAEDIEIIQQDLIPKIVSPPGGLTEPSDVIFRKIVFSQDGQYALLAYDIREAGFTSSYRRWGQGGRWTVLNRGANGGVHNDAEFSQIYRIPPQYVRSMRSEFEGR